MTKPRPIIKGTTYLLTRRCFQRHYLLGSSPVVNQVFIYCMAVAQKKYGMLVHGLCVMSNHYHLVATDPEGNLPKFMHWLHEFVAKNLNIHYRRRESFWSPGSYSAVKLADHGAIVDKLAYTLNNPVSAGLVRSAVRWSGLTSANTNQQRTWHAKRPHLYFSRRSRLPASASLQFSPPPGVDAEVFTRELQIALEQREQTALQEREAERRRARNKRKRRRRRHKVVRHTDAATTQEPTRHIKPRIACRDPALRAEELRLLREFETEYRTAWLARQRGQEAAVFPYGTYWLAHCQKALPIASG